MPKPVGAVRSLRIPIVRDVMVLQAARVVLEPILEEDFLPISCGQRPK